MKEIIYYEAEDGTRFDNADACTAYERKILQQRYTACASFYDRNGATEIEPINWRYISDLGDIITASYVVVITDPTAEGFDEIANAMELSSVTRKCIKRGSVLVYLDNDCVMGWSDGWYLLGDILDAYNELGVNALKQTNLRL